MRDEALDPDAADAGGLTRRGLLARGAAAAAVLGLPTLLRAPAAGAARAAGGPIKIGFIALTDCASVVMAHELGFFEQRGVEVQLVKQASWPATRDALVNGDIDAAHALFSLPLSVAAGIGGTVGADKLKVAMMLNQNGQAITLKKDWAAAGYGNLKAAKSVMKGGEGTYAMTFPGGTHDIWLRYWLKAMGIGVSTPKIIPIPPPQMVANMQVGAMDAFCVGEPWNGVAAQRGVGFTALATQDIWQHHPEKALVVNNDFATARRAELKKVMGAILEASKWLDFTFNREKTADTVGRAEYVNAPADVIQDRLNGRYILGNDLGMKLFRGDQMRFHRAGKVNFPRKAHAIWFLSQYVRLGLLKAEPNYNAIASSVILGDLYREVAAAEKVPVPNDDMAPFDVKLDGVSFDPRKPSKEAKRK
jgi:nitrate/nitrite transport system substrate-binding protein